MQIEKNIKYEMLDIDINKVCREIKREVFAKELYSIKEDELFFLQETIGEIIELDIETQVLSDNTRKSFYLSNNRIVVIKNKKINIKLFFDILDASYELIDNRIEKRIAIIIELFIKLFFNVLNKDSAIVYSYLCNEYFIHARQFKNTEVNERINQYLKKKLGLSWSEDKILEILRYLEEDIRVIECRNGVFHVNDKIYFN